MVSTTPSPAGRGISLLSGPASDAGRPRTRWTGQDSFAGGIPRRDGCRTTEIVGSMRPDRLASMLARYDAICRIIISCTSPTVSPTLTHPGTDRQRPMNHPPCISLTLTTIFIGSTSLAQTFLVRPAPHHGRQHHGHGGVPCRFNPRASPKQYAYRRARNILHAVCQMRNLPCSVQAGRLWFCRS